MQAASGPMHAAAAPASRCRLLAELSAGFLASQAQLGPCG